MHTLLTRIIALYTVLIIVGCNRSSPSPAPDAATPIEATARTDYQSGSQTFWETISAQPRGSSRYHERLLDLERKLQLDIAVCETGFYPEVPPAKGAEPGCYYKTRLTEASLRAFVGRFGLVEAGQTHDLLKHMLTAFPEMWAPLHLDSCRWFEGKGNRIDGNYGMLVILVADQEAGYIYLLCSSWDYTP